MFACFGHLHLYLDVTSSFTVVVMWDVTRTSKHYVLDFTGMNYLLLKRGKAENVFK